MKRNSTFAGRFALTGVAAAALCLVQLEARALGLGRLQVQSALGESLRAEIDVTSMTADEAANLRVRIAAPEAYRTAGVDYNPVLPGSDVSLQRRADGKPYLRLTSSRGVQEPFVDVILDLSWSTGRLVREYTLLFDPPVTARASGTTSSVANASVPAMVATAMPAATPMAAAAPVPPIDGSASAAPAVERRARVRPAPVEAANPPPASPPVASAPRASAPRPPAVSREAGASAPAGAGKSEYRVRPGDSLSRIASRTQPPGVSLDQMLVSLFRSNPNAFMDSNMNRLRSGAVLSVPDADAANAISANDARQVIQAQSADFGAYRQRLAGVVPSARMEGSSRQLSGKVQATVTDNQQTAAPAPDKLTLSKGGADDQRNARDREKKAADVRVAELSKNVDELKKLSSAASQPAAAVPKPLASAPAAVSPPVVSPPVVAAPPPVPAPVVVATPAPAAPPPAPASAAPAPAPEPVVAAASAPAAVASATAPAPVVVASTPAASAVVPAASAPASAPEPTTSEPGVLGSLLNDNPVALGVGALLVLGLGGFAAYRFSKRGKRDSGETSFLESRLQPDSFFGASGGQHIDTRDAGGASSSMSYSLSQLDAIGDVDPVAEADVYLAYGRDLQAEEILKEAMRSNPDRLAIRTKLLEVYAKRRDTKGFELLATQLYALTHGVGEDWNKAQELGRQIDPENPLYRPGGSPQTASNDGSLPVEPLGASTMPQSVLPTPSQFNPRAADHDDDLSLDLDLGDPDAGTPTAPGPLDLMGAFGTPQPQPTSSSAARPEDEDAMLLDFSMPDLGVPEASSPPAVAAPAPVRREEGMPFDLSKISFDLDDEHPPATANETTAPTPPRPSELGGLDLSSDAADGEADDSEPLARKLELAEEFRQIGDTDGARDLLQEVIAKASGAVKTRAQGMLADLG